LVHPLSFVPQIAPYLPSQLVGATDWLVRGGDFEFWRAVVATIALTMVLLTISQSNAWRPESCEMDFFQ
jgi:hypothetical protein